jgi:YD repeat-containing protein
LKSETNPLYYALDDPQADPAPYTKSYEYNAAGLLSQRVDEEGFTAEYVYDEMGRMTKTTYSGKGSSQICNYVYDLAGQLVRYYTAINAPTIIDRDILGRVEKVTYPSGYNRKLEYEWDPAGNLKKVTYADNTTTA